MSEINIEKIYICHWNKLIERKKILIQSLDQIGLNKYEFVENYIAAELDEEEISKEYPFIFKPNQKNRYLRKSEISLALKHCWIVKDAFDKNYEDVLILEDDVKLEYDFIERFNYYKSQLPTDWDIAWIGGCCNLHSKNILPNINVYKENSSRCAHAFIISKIGLSKIKNHISDINEAIDWYYNTLILELELKNYWFEPILATQNNEFKSTVQ